MVEFVTGNLLEAGVDALVNTVNTEGVMGKGVALQFKRAFPANYNAYRAACAAGDVKLGRMVVFDTGRLERPRYIINFPSSANRGGARGTAGPRARVRAPRRAGTRADARTPPAAAHDTVPSTLIWLLSRYLAPGESASPLEVQKLLYFLQEAGEQLNLGFEKHRYGPYADAARRAVQSLEGHQLIGFGDGTGPGGVRLLSGALEEATVFLANRPDTRERYERVKQLIDGFETPYGLELLASTHWVALHEHANDPATAAERVRAWSSRKGHLFTDEHVAVAWQRLAEGGWLASARTPVAV